MIIGIGNDIVNIERILAQLDKYGEKFKDKCFTINEVDASKRYSDDQYKLIAAHFAKRFAAKEAFAKAIGSGIGKNISFKDIEILNDENGKPFVVVNEKLQKIIQKTASGNGYVNCHLSMSDDYPYAMAFVVIEVN